MEAGTRVYGGLFFRSVVRLGSEGKEGVGKGTRREEGVAFFDVDYILTMTSGRFPFFSRFFWVSVAVSLCLPRVKGERRGMVVGGSSLAVPEHSSRWLASP